MSRPDIPGFSVMLATQFAAVETMFQATPIFAFISGNMNAYNLIHAPQPDFSRIPRAMLISPDRTRNIPHVFAQSVGRGAFVPSAPVPRFITTRGTDPLSTRAQAVQARRSTVPAPAGGRTSSLLIHKGYVTLSPSPISGSAGTYGSVLITCYAWNIDDGTYEAAGCPTLTITSTNSSVATMDSSGNVSFIGAGTTSITVLPVLDTSATLLVTVTSGTPTPAPTPTPTPAPTPCPPGWFGVAPNCTSPTPTPQPTTTPAPPLSASTTGINSWWTYEEGSIAGGGKWMLNIANGNLVVQDDDVDVPERGIDLAFRRKYNSQSQHDYANTDGSVPSNYGNGWTSTFDAHMGYNAATGKLSVYDIDGARYDYCPDGAGGWASCTAGMHNTLVWDTTTNCHYYWTKKNGTVYDFYAPSGGCSGVSAGVNGRLNYIGARNHNNWIRFDYAFVGGDTAHNLSMITVTHQDTQALTLTFADFAGNRLLASIARPDGQTVTYQYDANANLTDVYEIGNDAALNATPIHHQYGWNANHQMALATSPNWTQGNPHPGSFDSFSYDGSNRVVQTQYTGIVNFTPNDGTGWALQQGILTTGIVYRNETFAYTAGQTHYADTDGHSTIYTYDSIGRETTRQVSNGSIFLVSTAAWDPDNNMVASVDPRGAATGNPSAYETDYAYDSNGNTIAVAQPSVSTNQGVLRPTTLLTYDSYNNVIASCDPTSVGASGFNWSAIPLPRDSGCTSRTYRTTYTYSGQGTGIEPFGVLVTATTPLGYHRQFQYNTSAQGGDFGLPSDVIGDSMVQEAGRPARQPHQAFTYDPHGNLATYSAGNGTSTLAYDTENRMTSVTDGDGVTSRTCYFDNGQITATQSAKQFGADGGATCGSNSAKHTYDADGNELTTVRHFGNVAGTTQNWYDGDDRLVEVALPHDSSDAYSYQWLTRSIYDLSQGQPLTAASASGLYAHGNLYKTQEWVGDSSPTWTDLKADAYDALDRQTAHYQYQTGEHIFRHASTLYDLTSASVGLLGQKIDALNETTSYAYDANGKTLQVTYAGDGGVTPSETMAYDPNGRPTTTTSSTMGSLMRSYDADGRQIGVQEAAGGGMTSAAAYTYDYYADGMKRALSVNSSALAQTNLLQYSYRTDGARDHLSFADGSASASMTWTLSPAGRVQSIADSSGQPARALIPDGYGQVQQDQMASGTTSTIVHDDEGELIDYTVPQGYQANIWYTVRGEFHQQYWTEQYISTTCTSNPPNQSNPADASNPAYNPITQQSANGFMRPTGCNGEVDPNSPSFDYRTGAITGTPSTSMAYDAAGRQTTSSQSWTWYKNCGNESCNQDETGSKSRSYDAENHLISNDIANWNYVGGTPSGCLSTVPSEATAPQLEGGVLTYAWGPNGHPDLWNQQHTLHWDGDAPLFVTSSSGVEEIKVEGLGYYVPGSPFKFLDRNESGFVVAAHWSGGHSAWTPADAQHQTCDGTDLSGAVLFEPGADGIGDGTNIIQGVRAYDPGTGQWTSPDAYSGDVRDPMSQKSFMWNNNNSLSYEDPTGYDKIIMYSRDVNANVDHGSLAHLFIEVHNDKGAITQRYSFGPSNEGNPFYHDSNLVSKGPGYDRSHADGRDTYGRTVIGSCTGTCTSTNGHFDESSLAKTAAAIDRAKTPYTSDNNSNSGAYTMCANAGGSNCGSTDTGGRLAPGDGNLVVPLTNPTNGKPG